MVGRNDQAGWAAEKSRRSSLPPEVGDGDDVRQLVAVRNRLHESLEKSREVGNLLHERLRSLQCRLSPVTAALAPVEEESEALNGLSQRIDRATQSIMSVQASHDVVHKLRRRIMRDPAVDLDGYLAAVMQLEEALSFHRHELAAAGLWLQEAVQEAAAAHSRQTERLRSILQDLKSEQAGERP
jgi:exocyst complex protein 7